MTETLRREDGNTQVRICEYFPAPSKIPRKVAATCRFSLYRRGPLSPRVRLGGKGGDDDIIGKSWSRPIHL
jgi:hypothetical protein